MAPKKIKIPTPEELLKEVSGTSAAKTYPFDDYMEAVHTMQEKGYSYAHIAEFLTKRLGQEFSKGQVYRGYTIWLKQQEALAAERENSREEEFADLPPDPDEEEKTALDAELDKVASEICEFLEETYPSGGPETGAWTFREALKRAEARYAQIEADENAAEAADKQKGKKGSGS